jgi:hypothetical protein
MSESGFATSQQEGMDRLLRWALGSQPAPVPAPGFEQRLARRLAPRRLSSSGRLVLGLYALAALAGSVGVMRSEAIGWGFIVVAVVVPLVVLASLWRRHLSLAS